MTIAAPARPATTVAEAAARTIAKVCGTIISIELQPHDAAPQLRARLVDETGEIDAIFMGRRLIAGIEPGQRLSIEGRVCRDAGTPRIFNPRYELMCRP